MIAWGQKTPSWDALFRTACAQSGVFTTEQAAEAGYSNQLLAHHLKAHRIARVARGIYRLTHFPTAEDEYLAVVWLWSKRLGVFSHETALSLHGLSDAMPIRLHLTLPRSWQRRRLTAPTDVELAFADIPVPDRTWFGVVPVTCARRTIQDCAAAHTSPDLLLQAARQAIGRGLIDPTDISL